jgi:hypothetical protein
MVERVDAVAEVDNASDRALDEQVLIPDEDDADDLGQRSSVVQSRSGRITPRMRPVKGPRALTPSFVS